MTGKDFGLSKKTNVAMTSAGCFAAVGVIGSPIDWRIGITAIVAAFFLGAMAITYQFVVDYWKK